MRGVRGARELARRTTKRITSSHLRGHSRVPCYHVVMPPKRGKKGKRRGDSLSDDDVATAAAAAVAASIKSAAVDDSDDDLLQNQAGSVSSAQAKSDKKAKGKKKGKRKGDQDESDEDSRDALDPLVHQKGGARRALKGEDDRDVEERPKKPLTKKEKRRLEEEQRREKAEVRSTNALFLNACTKHSTSSKLKDGIMFRCIISATLAHYIIIFQSPIELDRTLFYI